MIDSETPISGVKLGSTPIPLKIKASDINSENATQGQALLADGQGGATWGNAGGGQKYRHFIKFLSGQVTCEIISNDNTLFTYTTLASYLNTNGIYAMASGTIPLDQMSSSNRMLIRTVTYVFGKTSTVIYFKPKTIGYNFTEIDGIKYVTSITTNFNDNEESLSSGGFSDTVTPA